MKIVIVGAGKVGRHIAQDLGNEGHDVIIIDKSEGILNAVMAELDVSTLTGSGTDYDVLKEVGCEDCEIFIAVTNQDETNIISALFAKQLGAQNIIARVRMPEYAKHMDFLTQNLGIHMALNPEQAAAEQMAMLLRYPTAIEVNVFGQRQIKLVAIRIHEKSPFANQALYQLNKLVDEFVLVGLVKREGKTLIPNGQFVIEAGDIVYITGTDKAIDYFYKKSGNYKRTARSILLIGGGRISYYLIMALQNTNIDIKVIELERNTARMLADRFPHITVIWADGTDQKLLTNEHISSFNAVAALTGVDEENILISLFAEKIGISKVITKINRVALLEILGEEQLDSVVTPKSIIADKIVGEIRAIANSGKSPINMLYRIGEEVEVGQFKIEQKSHFTNVPLKDLTIKEVSLILFIFRQGKVVFPTGNDVLLVGDEIGVLMRAGHLAILDGIFLRSEHHE